MHVGRRIWLLVAVASAWPAAGPPTRARSPSCRDAVPPPCRSTSTNSSPSTTGTPRRSRASRPSRRSRCRWVERDGSSCGRQRPPGARAAPNFKLEVQAQGMPKADIGSNAEEFWFWVANPEKDLKWIYWCNYRDLETSDLPVTYQPDWIIEAMGLKPISPQEAATIKVGRGTDAGTTLLTFAATRNRGGPYVREMEVSNSDRRIKKLRIFSESAEGPDRGGAVGRFQGVSHRNDGVIAPARPATSRRSSSCNGSASSSPWTWRSGR